MKAVIQRTSDLKISKELIYEVLNIPKENIVDIYIDGKYLLIKKDNNRIEEHNIYEFAFKCKEWVYKNGYTIVDGIDELGESICYIMKITGYSLDNYYEQGINYKNVFTACEWILRELNK